MGFLKPNVKTQGTNVNNDLIKDIYTPQAEQGAGGMNFLSSLLTGQGDVGAAQGGFDQYRQNAGYEDALRRMSQSVVGGAAASGLLRSGSTAQALNAQGAEINKGYFDNYLQQLSGLGELGQRSGQLLTGAGSGEPYKSPSTAGIIAGVGGKLLGSIFSDRRLKENIVEVGRYPNGLPMYEFNYKGGEQRLRGIMSDDVRKVFPDAVVVMADGFDAVHYDMLGIEMEQV